MSKGAVNFSKDNEYYTPYTLVKKFGKFDYDPATTEEKAAEFGISFFDTIGTNGLLQDWSNYQKIWINPPFTQKKDFLEKAVQTFIKNRSIEIYILFPIGFLTTKEFHKLMRNVGGKIFLPNGRIKFESGLGKESKSPAFGSVVVKLQNDWEIELFEL